jgi:hypothetical protein
MVFVMRLFNSAHIIESARVFGGAGERIFCMSHISKCLFDSLILEVILTSVTTNITANLVSRVQSFC